MKAPRGTKKEVWKRYQIVSSSSSESGESEEYHPKQEEDRTTGDRETDDPDEEILEGEKEGDYYGRWEQAFLGFGAL